MSRSGEGDADGDAAVAGRVSDGRRQRARRGEGEQLRDEIITATEELLLETSDVDQVSIRAVAAAVGVTAPSIYRHFPDKEALIFEVCSRHFTQLGEQIAELTAGIDDPVESLAIAGRSYVRFAVENPEYYRIMFMTRGEFAPPELYEHMRSGAPLGVEVPTDVAVFRGVMTYIQQGVDSGRLVAGDPYRMALHMWAQVHGLAALVIAKPNVKWPPLDELIDEHIQMSVRGLIAD